jgi:hypothetical protein
MAHLYLQGKQLSTLVDSFRELPFLEIEESPLKTVVRVNVEGGKLSKGTQVMKALRIKAFTAPAEGQFSVSYIPGVIMSKDGKVI